MPKKLIEKAKSQITTSEQIFEDLIADLETSRVTIEKERLQAEQYRQEIEKLRKQAKDKQEKIDNRRDKIIQEANEQALAILKEAKETADASIRNFHKFGTTNPTANELEKERTALREKMNAAQSRMEKKQKQPSENTKAPKKLRLGDAVQVLTLNQRGIVTTLPNAKGELFVQMGILRTQVNIKDLVLLQEDTAVSSKKTSRASLGKIKMSKSSSISAEINLIGRASCRERV